MKSIKEKQFTNKLNVPRHTKKSKWLRRNNEMDYKI